MRIYIKPTTKERPRFNTSTGRAFTTNKTREFEETLKWEYIKIMVKTMGEILLKLS